MKKLALALLALSIAAPASAEDKGKITVQEAQQLSTALRNLDGRMIVIKQNGADNVIMQPWEFGSGVLRLRIANDIAIVDHSLKLVEEVRLGMVKEGLQKIKARTGDDATDMKPGTPEFDEFQKQYQELISQPAPGTQDLARIKASDLKLDKNEIPVTVLTALAPIMDNDVK
jgi:hypothetical protein